MKISLQFVARYDVNWIYLYPERIQLLSQLDRCEGRTQRTKCWKYTTPLLQFHYLSWYFTTKVLRSIFRSDINSVPGTQRALLSWEFLSPEVDESKWEQIMEDRMIEAYVGL